jgi:hypothetical protein
MMGKHASASGRKRWLNGGASWVNGEPIDHNKSNDLGMTL